MQIEISLQKWEVLLEKMKESEHELCQQITLLQQIITQLSAFEGQGMREIEIILRKQEKKLQRSCYMLQVLWKSIEKIGYLYRCTEVKILDSAEKCRKMGNETAKLIHIPHVELISKVFVSEND